MALSVVDLYVGILPRTNCKDCGYKTCLAFAGMVVSEKLPLKNCPHIQAEILQKAQAELDEQHRQGKWLKKDMATEAFEWARQRAGSMEMNDIAARIGGEWIIERGRESIRLPVFNRFLSIEKEGIRDENGDAPDQNEQTFVYIHMAQGGTSSPSGKMKSLKEFPNTVSKIVTMRKRVELPLIDAFGIDTEKLKKRCLALGGQDSGDLYPSGDLAYTFKALPKVPVVLLFWKGTDGFEADAKLLFDETILDHLDIESILFMSETLCNRLLRDGSPDSGKDRKQGVQQRKSDECQQNAVADGGVGHVGVQVSGLGQDAGHDHGGHG